MLLVGLDPEQTLKKNFVQQDARMPSIIPPVTNLDMT
jgi:hypothetical protein